MKTERVARVLAEMRKLGLSQMIITDPTSISYLAVHYENPIERFWALYLREDGQHKLVANRLFTLNDVSDVDILWYTDSEDGTAVLNPYIDHPADGAGCGSEVCKRLRLCGQYPFQKGCRGAGKDARGIPDQRCSDGEVQRAGT